MLEFTYSKERIHIDEDDICRQSTANPNLTIAKGLIFGTLMSVGIWVGIIAAIYTLL